MSHTVLTVDRVTVRVERVNRRGRRMLGAWPAEAPDGAGIAAAVALVKPAGHRRVVLALGPGWAQLRRVSTLPPVRRRALRSILARQPLRYLRRMSQGPLIVDACWVVDEKGTRVALFAGAAGGAVGALMDEIGRGGLRVSRVVPAGFERAGIDLTPPGHRRQMSRLERRRSAVLALGLALLWLGFGAWRWGQVRTEDRRLSERLAELEPASRAVASAGCAVQDAERMVLAFDSLLSLRAGLTVTVVKVAAALPPDAYIDRVVLLRDRPAPERLQLVAIGHRDQPQDRGRSDAASIAGASSTQRIPGRRANPVRGGRRPAGGAVSSGGMVRARWVAGLGCSVALLVVSGIGYRSFTAAARRVVAERVLLGRREASLRSLPGLEARADSVRERVASLQWRLLPGTTAAEAEAELLARIERAAAREAVQLELAEAVPDSLGQGGLDRVKARATWVGDLKRALAVLRRLEYGRELLLVRELRIDGGGGGLGAETGAVRTQVVVEGWFLKREGS